MGYQPYPLDSFRGGLNLRDKPDAVDPAFAIDAIDVLYGERGAIVQRSGYGKLTSSALTNRVASLEAFYRTSGANQLLAGCGTRLEALSITGAVVDSETGLSAGIWDFARFGGPTAEVAYAGNGANALRKFDGSTWTAPTATIGEGEEEETGKAMPKAGLLCVQPFDNRMVLSGFQGASDGPNGFATSPSHVYWSLPGNPEGYHELLYEQFTPGDGERVMAVIPWREFTFVFKETKFFVVSDMTLDPEANAEPVYRPVETGVGLASSRAVAVHPSGVYFMSRGGVYRTTGGEPELVSSLISPIWSGAASPFYTGGGLDHGSIENCAMGTIDDRIWLAFATDEANDRVLVFDPQFDWWSLLALPASCLTTFRVGSHEELVFGYSAGANHVGHHSASFTNDDGAAIKSRWRSGWADLGNADMKKIRGTKFWGTGKVHYGLDSDFQIEAGVAEDLDMSGEEDSTFEGEGVREGDDYFEDTTNVLVGVQSRIAERGTTFSMFFSNDVLDQSWSVHRAEHLIPKVRDPAHGTK